MDPDRNQAFGVEKGNGLIIKRLFPDGAAGASGLQVNDVITTINGKPAQKRYEIGNAVANGAAAEIGYLRDGKPALFSREPARGKWAGGADPRREGIAKGHR